MSAAIIVTLLLRFALAAEVAQSQQVSDGGSMRGSSPSTAHARIPPDPRLPVLPPAPVPTPVMLTAVSDFQLALGSPILVAAAGPRAEEELRALRRMRPRPLVEIKRVPTLGDVDSEMQHAMSGTGLGCAIRVAPSGNQLWNLSLHGICKPRANAEDLLLQAEMAAENLDSENLPPGESARLLEEADLGSPLDEYRVRRLKRQQLAMPSRQLYGAMWVVQDGRGRIVTTREFANLTGDVATRLALMEEMDGSVRRIGLQLGTGGLFLGISGIIAASAHAEYPSWSDFKVSRYSYTSKSAYKEALAEAREEYQAAVDDLPYSVKIDAEQRTWTSVVLAGTGLMIVATAPFIRPGIRQRQKVPALYYGPGQAQALIDAYNQGLLDELRLRDPSLALPDDPQAMAEPAPPPCPLGGKPRFTLGLGFLRLGLTVEY